MTIPGQAVRLGRMEYSECHRLQQALVARRAADTVPDTLLLVEHPHVITCGRRARSTANLIATDDVPVVEVERGGDVTYHGPGQLVLYPIVALGDGERDAPGFIRRLEGWVIDALAGLGLPDAEARPGFSGVWCRDRKLASVGIAVTARWITWHGIALNVTTDLAWFQRIRPCGLQSGVMGSVQSLTGAAIPLDRVGDALLERSPAFLGRDFRRVGSTVPGEWGPARPTDGT